MRKVPREMNALAAIAARDVMRFLRSPGSIVASMVFPVICLGIMGGSTWGTASSSS